MDLGALLAKARRVRWRIVGVTVISVGGVLTSTAFAADGAAEQGNLKLLMAVVGLCVSVVSSMLFVVRSLFAWLKRVEPTLPRRERGTSSGQDMLDTNGLVGLLRRQVDWQSRRLDDMDRRFDRQDKHFDERMDDLKKDVKVGQTQIAGLLQTQARLATAVEDLAKKLPAKKE